MSSTKTACVVSLGSLLALIAGFMLTSEVRAGGIHDSAVDVPIAAAVSQDTIAQASAFAGDYTFIGGQKERDGIDAAIETSMEALAPLMRGIGRKRIKETNPVPKQLHIAVDGDAVTIEFDGHGFEAGLDGTPVRATSQYGDKVKVVHKLRGDRLHERVDGDKGGRTNSFKLSNDGAKLYLDVEISSSHLPVPVEYRLTFKRKG